MSGLKADGKLRFSCRLCEMYVVGDPVPWESTIEDGVFYAICMDCFAGKVADRVSSQKTAAEQMAMVRGILFGMRSKMERLGIRHLQADSGPIPIHGEEDERGDTGTDGRIQPAEA